VDASGTNRSERTFRYAGLLPAGPTSRDSADPGSDPHPRCKTGADWFRHRIRDLRSKPDFAIAAADYARDTVRLFEGRYLANKAMANVARQTVCVAILSAHFGQVAGTGGAFLSSIQTLTTAMRVCSKNTTAATVALLERLGLVVRIENPDDRRWLHIRPTEDLISAAADFRRISLTTADALFPSGNYHATFDGDRNIQERCFAVGLYSFIAIYSSVFDLEESHVFTSTDGGMVLLLKLLSMRGTGDASGSRIVEFPFDEIGSLFGLSRTHVRRLVRKAEAGGFLRLLQKGGRRIEILPPLEDLFENIVAANVAGAQLDVHIARGDDELLRLDGGY
jgi:hypothetical protein